MEFRFEEIRDNHDLSKTDVARKIGIGIRNYNYIESEKANIKLRILNDYCNIFGYSMNYVCNLTSKYSLKDNKQIDTINKKIMAERLKIIEKEQKLESIDIAKLIGVAQSTYSEYKNSKLDKLIQTLMLKKIAITYNYSMDWIVGRSEQKKLK